MESGEKPEEVWRLSERIRRIRLSKQGRMEKTAHRRPSTLHARNGVKPLPANTTVQGTGYLPVYLLRPGVVFLGHQRFGHRMAEIIGPPISEDSVEKKMDRSGFDIRTERLVQPV